MLYLCLLWRLKRYSLEDHVVFIAVMEADMIFVEELCCIMSAMEADMIFVWELCRIYGCYGG